jgi:radical SAM protein with 4Fe4S-binding SPASM domain
MIFFFIRGFNLLKIISGYLISRITKRVFHWGNPVAASFEPTSRCNLHCPECPAGLKTLTRISGEMSPGLFQSAINSLLPHLSYLTLYFQGEPYLSKNFFDFIAFARSKQIFVATSSNGHFLDELSVIKTIESGLNRLIISVDGADQESYQAYRMGGDFDRVISGIRLLVREKKRLKSQTPKIILQCLMLKSNEHQLGEIRRLAKELGVDKLEFKTAQFYDYQNGNPLMPENPVYSRYRQQKMSQYPPHSGIQPDVHQFTSLPVHQFTLKLRMPNSCFRMWSSCVITWDGKVVPCCFDKDADHVMGDLTRQRFADIWRDKPYHDFRGRILKNRKSVDICSNCSQTY